MGNMCLLCVGYRPTMGEAVYLASKTNTNTVSLTTPGHCLDWIKMVIIW